MTARARAPRALKAGKAGNRRPPIIVYRRKRPPPLPPLSAPLNAVITCLDSARRTGWAVYVRGALHAFGECDARDRDARHRVLARAVTAAAYLGIPCALHIEIPYGGYTATVLSLTETATLWRETWSLLGLARDRCVERTAGEWRRTLWGSGRLPREQARALEAHVAGQIVARDLTPGTPIGADAAAAICIGQTIVRAREMLAVLGCGVWGKRERKRAVT